MRYQDIKKYGLTQLAETIVKDVQEIENGIELPDGNVAIGTASALSGDTLGIQMFCGFKESSTALHPCRYCLASLEEIRIMIREEGQRLRSPSTHDEQIEKIETAATEEEKKILSQDYGINRSCLLRKLLGFHPTTSTPPDISNDLFAGIVLLQIKLFLNRFCIKENWITLEDFNQRVADFDYGYSEKSAIPSAIKLAHISGKNNLRQTISQSWMLAVILPFIVHDKMNDENIQYLENHNQLLEIIAIVCSHTISLETLSYLESLIPLYLETYAQVYENPESAEGRKFIPKQHFLIHYPRLIKIFGPLVHFWTLRFEAKHQFFKKIVQAMRNWKNVPITLSRKHQLWQALQWIASTNVEEISHGPKKCLTKSKTLFGHLFPSEQTLWTVSWVELNHVIEWLEDNELNMVLY
ncbi:uncharacterized protein LOC122505700 [Leptopilina heterotoma]|uniref:uncharacterized protein LOC122505700 n=1 Tax=Leptopilina heterotoma TaxID=63436 RepID=UPI001CA7FCAA|nr:uncharacterized protein LOC122505700 [Leptopilina heterotoma]